MQDNAKKEGIQKEIDQGTPCNDCNHRIQMQRWQRIRPLPEKGGPFVRQQDQVFSAVRPEGSQGRTSTSPKLPGPREKMFPVSRVVRSKLPELSPVTKIPQP